MPTISAYTSNALKREIDRIVREEGRNQAQVGQSALALYASLPSSARRALIELTAIEEQTGEPMIENVAREFALALLRAKWEMTGRAIQAQAQERGDRLNPGMTEEEIADLAVRMTRSPSRR